MVKLLLLSRPKLVGLLEFPDSGGRREEHLMFDRHCADACISSLIYKGISTDDKAEKGRERGIDDFAKPRSRTTSDHVWHDGQSVRPKCHTLEVSPAQRPGRVQIDY